MTARLASPRRLTTSSALTALALTLGVLSQTAQASAAEANPLLGKSAQATALSADQMQNVQGTGYWANYYGSLGLTYLGYAKTTGYYARWNAPANSYSEYSNYSYAKSYATTAATYFGWANYYSYHRQ
jgi:hypothetical protein